MSQTVTSRGTGSGTEPIVPLPGKAYRGLAMEGSVARWYTRTRGSDEQIRAWTAQAAELTRDLRPGDAILEVAPGPGYFSVALARAGEFRVAAVDISRTFVGIVADRARAAGVRIDLRLGDAAALPFPEGAFDLVVCQAAFKNFSRPQAAINDMFRVLRPGGLAWIEDMRHDVTDAALRQEVRAMHLTRGRGWMTYHALKGLRNRAYTSAEFDAFARQSPFGNCRINFTPIGLEVRLRRSSAADPPETAA